MAKKAAKKRPQSGVTAEEFCKAYKLAADTGQSIDDLSKKLGMSKPNIISRRTSYEKTLQMKFPKLARAGGGPRLDVEALKKIMKGK